MTDTQAAQPLTPVERFLSDLVRSALKSGLHTPTELVERFPPDAIMSFLNGEPAKRARILIEILGFPEKTAHKLSAVQAGGVLQTAFEAEEAQPSKIIAAIEPDDIARHFPKVALWAFLDDGEWWMKPKAEKQPAKEFALVALDAMRSYDLTAHECALDRLGIAPLARFLPKELLEHLFEDATVGGLRREPFTPDRVFRIVTAQKLVEHVPLEVLHANLLVPLATDHGITRSALKAPILPSDEEVGPATRAATPFAHSSAPPAAKLENTPILDAGPSEHGDKPSQVTGPPEPKASGKPRDRRQSAIQGGRITDPAAHVRTGTLPPGAVDEAWPSDDGDAPTKG
ncbi:MAG TPA: hypothetical protein VN397_01740 [Candidatus Methylomirabilis sp.]|nr:hypothetical protein [Candidatus Methylomirabilis sp.]